MFRHVVLVGLVSASAACGQEAADRAAISKSASEFQAAFNAGDAQRAASSWTENGENRDAAGRTLVGRGAIEKAFADLFKADPSAKVEVLVKSIRFPAKDLAVEEGLLRHTSGSKPLPYTTQYVAVHVREAGGWRIALSSESAAGQDRIEDLAWLEGDWTGKVKGDTVKISFARERDTPVMTATVSRADGDKKMTTRSIRIARDPETGQIRSWGFEPDGSHSQALWVRDAKGWILDVRGVLGDGTTVAERILLQRVGPDAIVWRAIDRMAGDQSLPDTTPARLTRERK